MQGETLHFRLMQGETLHFRLMQGEIVCLILDRHTVVIYRVLYHIPRAEMTLPRQTRDLLMLPPSFSRIPSAPVALARSL